jgi:hypothetical protein
VYTLCTVCTGHSTVGCAVVEQLGGLPCSVFSQLKAFLTAYAPYCVLCTVYCVLCTVHCALCTVHCALCTVYCVLCTVYCVLCTVYCVLCTVYCLLCTVYCVLCTVHRGTAGQFEKCTVYLLCAAQMRPSVGRRAGAPIVVRQCSAVQCSEVQCSVVQCSGAPGRHTGIWVECIFGGQTHSLFK